MQTIISVVNHKGGTGKTTTVFNLADSLDYILNKKRKLNKKILLIDNDPQASLTSFYYDPDQELEESDTIISIYSDTPNYDADIILETKNPNIHLVGNMFFATTKETSLTNSMTAYARLKSFIQNKCQEYSVILIDNSPYFNAFTKNSFVISQHVIIPTELTRLSIAGIKEILAQIKVAKDINSEISLLGVLINKLDERNSTHHVIREKLYKALGDYVLSTEIHAAAAIQHAERKKKTIVRANKNTRAHKEFVQLATEILNKTGHDIEFNTDKVLEEKANVTE